MTDNDEILFEITIVFAYSFQIFCSCFLESISCHEIWLGFMFGHVILPSYMEYNFLIMIFIKNVFHLPLPGGADRFWVLLYVFLVNYYK